ncbi:Hypothetical protein PBC10988_31940 [Planctomycetales bacterium 10988]|nr:Hypothetical protein PBC10988_31940 [Planctomycetales bacterium 10988]
MRVPLIHRSCRWLTAAMHLAFWSVAVSSASFAAEPFQIPAPQAGPGFGTMMPPQGPPMSAMPPAMMGGPMQGPMGPGMPGMMPPQSMRIPAGPMMGGMPPMGGPVQPVSYNTTGYPAGFEVAGPSYPAPCTSCLSDCGLESVGCDECSSCGNLCGPDGCCNHCKGCGTDCLLGLLFGPGVIDPHTLLVPNMLGGFTMGNSFSGRPFIAPNGFIPLPPNVNPAGPLPVFPPQQVLTDSGNIAVAYPFKTYKAAENQSPFPRNRIYGEGLYADEVNGTDEFSKALFGFESTLLGGCASIGFQLPYYSIDTAASPAIVDSLGQPVGGFGLNPGEASDIGDLTMILKYSPFYDRQNGNIFTLGLSTTFATGPDLYGDVLPIYEVQDVKHSGSIQPWVAFNRFLCPQFCGPSGWYVQGFAAVDAPFDGDDATYFYGDIGIGNYIQQSNHCFITAITPLFEVHLNTPLRNEEQFLVPSPGLAPTLNAPNVVITNPLVEYHTQVDLTAGFSVEILQKTTFSCGVSFPMVGPLPYDYQVQAQLNIYPGGFGGQ